MKEFDCEYIFCLIWKHDYLWKKTPLFPGHRWNDWTSGTHYWIIWSEWHISMCESMYLSTYILICIFVFIKWGMVLPSWELQVFTIPNKINDSMLFEERKVSFLSKEKVPKPQWQILFNGHVESFIRGSFMHIISKRA